MTSTPCSVCSKKVFDWHRAILCDLCKNWVHIKCNKLDNKSYKYHSANPNAPFSCFSCVEEHIPFSKLDSAKFKLAVIKGINFVDEVEFDIDVSVKNQALMDKINHMFHDNSDNSDDDDMNDNINCKYYNIDDFTNLKLDSNRNFSILHLNIHSIELHIEEFRIMLELLEFQFDLICISESKIQKDIAPKTDIGLPGFQTPLSTPSEAKKGGVLIYIKNGIDFKPRPDLSMYKAKELESLFIEIINPTAKNTLIGCVYRHPSMDMKSFNHEHLKYLVTKLSNEDKNKFIAGDFNFDLLKTSQHTESFEFLELLMTNLLLPTITLPTRINSVNNTLIDNIFSSDVHHPGLVSGNLAIGISDHLPSFLVIPKQNQNFLLKKHNIRKRDKSNFNREDFILDYLSINWDAILDLGKNDVNHSMNGFMNEMNVLLDKHMPLKKISRVEFKRRFKPWITNNILTKIRNKNSIFKKFVTCKDNAKKEEYKKQFSTLKNEITLLIKESKKTYYNNFFTNYRENLQKIWSGIKNIINVKSKNFDVPTCVSHEDQNVTKPIEIAEKFNDFYASIAEKILSDRKYEGNIAFNDFLGNPSPNSMALYPCDIEEVKTIIIKLNSGKAHGPNSIPTDILQLLFHDIAKPLTQIFNLSFKTGVHPDLLKTARVIPVFKKGSRLLVSNYRPISLLSNLNKILEKLMFKRVYDYLERNNAIYRLQFGFRSKHSTTHALIDITETIRKALDDKKLACGIFVDLQKAFDTVNHEILIKKLAHYGIRGVVKSWFMTYLTNRVQYVSIYGFESCRKILKHGVPQGSVLGPLLFLLYINDLHRSIKFSNVYHFADDTNLLRISNSPQQLQKHLNIDLKLLYKWLLANKISLNCSKTEMIIFRKPTDRISFKFKIKLNGHRLYQSDSIKYLGILLDSTLNWKHHCDILSKKLKRGNGMLMKIRHYVHKKELKSIYYALFSSHLNYGCQIWAQYNNVHTQRIFKLQNRAQRIIEFADFRDEANPLYKSNNILKLSDQVTTQNCLFVFDHLNKNLPQCFINYFTRTNEIHQIQTTSSRLGCLFLPRFATTKYGINSITRKCIINWNYFTRYFNCDLAYYRRSKLKEKLTSYFLNTY